MVSHQRTYLEKLRQKGIDEPKSTLNHLDTLVQQYPYFQALHHLGWKIAHNNKLPEESSLLKSCSLHTKSRLHLIPHPNTEAQAFVEVTSELDNTDEVRTFLDWLQQLENVPSKGNEQNRLIDKFITDAPRLVVSKSAEKQTDLTKKQQFDDNQLMTETLAEVYFKQGKLKKAIKAYEILALKYPEKSGFFADQIQKITNTQNES
ncbi:MAG: Uncharacterised protein [Bacteroidota bacterium]|nr:MAG: Uncharacterised protein [Bacteroidota bacterium]